VNTETTPDKASKKREIIKTLLIVFLAALLLLTFFSNTIMNRALAEITTSQVTSGKLTERIRATGIVEAEQTYEVKTDENRTVFKINIKAGQKVSEGDVLFTLGSAESASLSAAENELDALELEYNKLLLTPPPDYSSEDQQIKNAAEDLDQAIVRRDAALAAQKTSAQAKAQYNADRNEAKRLSALRDKLSANISAIDGDDYTSASAELIGDLPALKTTWQTAENEYAAAYELYTKAVENGDAETALADCNAKDEKRASAKAEYDKTKSGIRAGLAAQLNDTEGKLSTVNARISAYEENVSAGGMSYEDCVADVQTKQRTLETLRINLAKTQNSNSVAQQQYALDLESKKRVIEKKRQEIETLRQNNTTVDITSKYSGTVRTVNVKPDEMTASGIPLAVIDLDDAGFKMNVSVETELAKKLSVGATAQVVNNWNGEAKAVLETMITDADSNGKRMKLSFRVIGSVTVGSNLEISLPLSSGQYQSIVPKSAVYSDQKGDFVYKVRSKHTPLGNRYYAERVSVNVIASDDNSSAVSGELTGSDSIITAFSKPITAGDQVRLKS
jgi:multidrug efflux pump subunit AcrA (membrane-fusion protein)